MSAAPIEPSERRIGVIISATEGKRLASSEKMLHEASREPNLDQAGLCGYIDPDPLHIGWRGHQFYVRCEPPTQPDFFIDCHPPYNGRQFCIEYVFIGRNINSMLFFDRGVLKDHKDIVDRISKLVLSFVRPITDEPG